MGWCLKVQATKHASLGGVHVVVLNENFSNTVLPEDIRPKCLGKKTALIAMLVWCQQQEIWNL
jgi:hypothetical protein